MCVSVFGVCVRDAGNPLLLSSESVETLEPPVTEESVGAARGGLAASSGRCAEIGQHGPVVLPLCCSLPIFLIVIPESRRDRKQD